MQRKLNGIYCASCVQCTEIYIGHTVNSFPKRLNAQCALRRKTTTPLNDSSKEKRLSVSVSGKKHKLLGVPSLGGGSLKIIYGQTVGHKVLDKL